MTSVIHSFVGLNAAVSVPPSGVLATAKRLSLLIVTPPAVIECTKTDWLGSSCTSVLDAGLN